MIHSGLITSTLICPMCKSTLKKKNQHLYYCTCSEHPFLDGVLCIYHPEPERKQIAIQYIKTGKIDLAKRTLVGNKYYFLLGFFFTLPFPQNISRILTIFLLSILFLDARMWFKYVFFRRGNRTYTIATQLVRRLNKTGLMVDLGTGSGEIMSEIYDSSHFDQFIGIDFSYQNLYFARKSCLQHKDVLLVCADLSLAFPLISKSTNFSLTAETFNYIPGLSHFVKEVARITSVHGGIACITSIHNIGFNNPSKTVTPEEMKDMIPKALKTTMITDTEILRTLQHNEKIKNSTKSEFKKNSSFTVIMEKN